MKGFTGRSPLKLKEAEKKMLEDGLAAAARTLWLMDSWRGRLPAGFIEECEGT